MHCEKRICFVIIGLFYLVMYQIVNDKIITTDEMRIISYDPGMAFICILSFSDSQFHSELISQF